MTLHLHRAARADQLADQLGELLRVAAGRSVRDRGGRGAGEGRRALAVASGSPTGSAPRRARRRGVCGRRLPVARARCSRVVTGTAGRRPLGADALAWPLLARHRRGLGEPWAATARAGTSATAYAGDEAEVRRGRRFADGPPAGAACSRRTPGSGRALVADWAAGRDTDGAGGDDPRRPDLAAAELWRRLAAAVEEPDPVRAAGRGDRAAARRPRDRRPAGAGLPVRPHPAARRPSSRCSTHWRRSRRPPLAAAPVGGPVVGARRASPGRRRARTTDRTSRSATRCSRRSGATPASCSGPCGDALDDRSTSRPPSTARRRRSRDTLLGWLQARPARQRPRPTPTRRHAAARRPLGPGARLPRPGPPGRGAARGAARAARGRPDAGAPRRAGDVPRHRDLRAAALGRLRPRPTWSAATATPRTGCG